MKTIQVDEELYRYIASHTERIGESASDILRRVLNILPVSQVNLFDVTNTNKQTLTETNALNHVAKLRSDERMISLENTSHEPLLNLLCSKTFTEQKKVVTRFISVLSTLYHLDPILFKATTESLQGRTRLYFANTPHALLQRGIQTKPKQISGTPYWVITNTNSERKRNIVESIMSSMKLPIELIEKVISAI